MVIMRWNMVIQYATVVCSAERVSELILLESLDVVMMGLLWWPVTNVISLLANVT